MQQKELLPSQRWLPHQAVPLPPGMSLLSSCIRCLVYTYRFHALCTSDGKHTQRDASYMYTERGRGGEKERSAPSTAAALPLSHHARRTRRTVAAATSTTASSFSGADPGPYVRRKLSIARPIERPREDPTIATFTSLTVVSRCEPRLSPGLSRSSRPAGVRTTTFAHRRHGVRQAPLEDGPVEGSAAV